MKLTAIQWTDYSTNPIVFHDDAGELHWHCEKVSAGCANCYAEALEKRFGGEGAGFVAKNTPHRRASLDEDELRRILKFKPKAGQAFVNGAGPLVFPFDMTDVFAPWVTDDMLDRLFAVMALRPDLTFQVLTKRPERMREYLANRRPLPNVWLGTSVESAGVLARVAELRSTPASKLFLSCEPLLGPLHGLAEWLNGIDWVIVGGESGPHARPCDIAWIRDIVAQCRAANVPVFVKQLGSKPYEFGVYEPLALDIGSDEPVKPGRGFVPEIIRLKDRHGGNPAEWPEDLRVREFPRSGMAADAS